ncbi:MAG: phosphotransferase enzyme family protein [Marinibacterium sp.]
MGGLYSKAVLEALESGVRGMLPVWGLPGNSDVSLLNISENATFLATGPDGGRPVILRVHRPGYHTRVEIESELAWITALRTDRVARIAAPLTCSTGGHVATFDDGGAPRDVVAFEFVPGREPEPVDALIAGFRDLGAISARLHRHAQGWARPAWFQRKSWTADTMIGAAAHWGHWSAAGDLTKGGEALLRRVEARIRQRLRKYGQRPDRFGLIHADLRLANLLVDPSGIAVIDFDDCGFGWFMSDFAASISFIETDRHVPDMLDAWIDGYRSVAVLDPSEVAEIPTFVMMRRMQLLAWVASHAETPTAQQEAPRFTGGTLALAESYLRDDTAIPQL